MREVTSNIRQAAYELKASGVLENENTSGGVGCLASVSAAVEMDDLPLRAEFMASLLASKPQQYSVQSSPVIRYYNEPGIPAGCSDTGVYSRPTDNSSLSDAGCRELLSCLQPLQF
jgi:hypothetical protein